MTMATRAGHPAPGGETSVPDFAGPSNPRAMCFDRFSVLFESGTVKNPRAPDTSKPRATRSSQRNSGPTLDAPRQALPRKIIGLQSRQWADLQRAVWPALVVKRNLNPMPGQPSRGT